MSTPRNPRFSVRLQSDGSVLIAERGVSAPRRWFPAAFVYGQSGYDTETAGYPDYVHAELWRQHDARQRAQS